MFDHIWEQFLQTLIYKSMLEWKFKMSEKIDNV